MPLTILDPQAALIVVDLQQGIVSASPDLHPVVERCRDLAKAFRAKSLPVVLVTVNGIAPGRTERPGALSGELPAGFADLVADLDPQPDDILVMKKELGGVRDNRSGATPEDAGRDANRRHRYFNRHWGRGYRATGL